MIATTNNSAVLIPAGTELSISDVNDVLNLATFGWAVETRYMGPTDTKGSRVSAGFAGTKGRKKSIPYEHALNPMGAHLQGALAFLNSLGNGCTEYRLRSVFSTEKGYVFTFS